ncbi:MAG: tyrosine-type recombinase/integrase [Deltaproteobacteria bacterium]|nr:tyrosine-type recombinase/integrase [Deltaproteobacteria bacterium]
MLTRGRLEEWDASMVASYEPSSREQALNIVMGFWRWAFDDEEVGEHFDRPRKLEVPGRVAKPVRAPTWAHMDEAIAACPHVPTKRAMVLMRCLGWRVGQVQRLEWQDVDLEAGTFQLRGELGKSRAEKIGRVVPIAKVLVDELAGWGVREGRIVNVSLVQVHKHMLRAWLASGAPAEVFEKKTGHAFRRGFRTELKAAGVDSEAIEFYCGRVIGVRELYTDPRALALAELVAAIPPFGSCVPGVSRLTARKTKIG